jgi:glycosyltransferase involved in cell wall biosynthesis
VRGLTIGIPAYNEEKNILNLLQSLEEQRNMGDTTISQIIISDDSSDNTPDLVKRYAQSSSLNIELFHHTARRGAAAGWNEIFKHAVGEVVVLYDADTVPHPLCTARLASSINGNTGLCASNTHPVQANGIAGRASVFISNWLRSVRLAGLSQYTVMGRALAINCKASGKIQLPADIIAIDLYLQCKVLEMGMDVVYNDEAIVFFKPANTMQDFVSQVIRAVNGHNQIRDYVSKFRIGLPAQVAIIQAAKNAIKGPLGALSAAIGYSMIPYYRSRLTQTSSAQWHTAQSSKAVDYQHLKSRY